MYTFRYMLWPASDPLLWPLLLSDLSLGDWIKYISSYYQGFHCLLYVMGMRVLSERMAIKPQYIYPFPHSDGLFFGNI